MNEKVRENRLRRAADRQRISLSKNRRRDPRAVGYGTYTLGNRDGLTLDEVERLLLVRAEL